ncbi:MAG: hypothetical protein WA969_10555 [Candidatus Microthrix parvicella]
MTTGTDLAGALHWVTAARQRWAQVLDALSDDAMTLGELWIEADRDPLVAQLKLLPALEARPGAKKVLTRRALDSLELSHSVTLGRLDGAERRRLEAVCADAAKPDPDAVAADDLADPAIVVISGPGGAGKGTVVQRLLAEDDRLWLSRSWTTRARRRGESADAYRWATPEEFAAHAAAGGFLEWVRFLDYCQGSPLPTPPEGHDVIFEVDVAGARSVRERWADARCVFIDTPSRLEQEARLRRRGDDPERVAQRLLKADEEVAAALQLGCDVVINDDLDATVAELQRLIATTRSNKARRLGYH